LLLVAEESEYSREPQVTQKLQLNKHTIHFTGYLMQQGKEVVQMKYQLSLKMWMQFINTELL